MVSAPKAVINAQLRIILKLLSTWKPNMNTSRHIPHLRPAAPFPSGALPNFRRRGQTATEMRKIMRKLQMRVS
jgi:hypothetical protein